MTTFDPKNDIPTEFYSAKTFFTVGGSAAAVWIFCLVIGAIFPQHTITPLNYRVIAIVLSEIIAVIMVFRLKTRKPENWFLAVFNGLLIFINASGWNVITANTFFSDKTSNAVSTNLRHFQQNVQQAGFFESLHQVQWWQDNTAFVKNIALAKENEELKSTVAKLKDQPPAVVTPPADGLADSLKSVLAKNQALEKEMKTLINTNLALKAVAQTSPVISDTLGNPERVRLVQSIGALRDSYESRLKNCETDYKQLQSKLRIVEHKLSTYSGQPND